MSFKGRKVDTEIHIFAVDYFIDELAECSCQESVELLEEIKNILGYKNKEY
jgi:hypothetical protein